MKKMRFTRKFKSKKHRSVRMKTFFSKTSRQKSRRVFAAMENLDNLSVNTRRFLSRSLMIQKWNDDESRIRKFVKPLKRRSSGNSSLLSDGKTVSIVRDAPTIVSEEVLSELDDSSLCEAYGETFDGNSDKLTDGILHERETGEEEAERSFEAIKNDSIAHDESQCKIEPSITDETENQNCNVTTEEGPIQTEDDIVDETVKSLVSEKLSDAFSSYTLRSPKCCKYCRESNETVVMYAGPPSNAKTEREILDLDALKFCEEDDDRAQFKLTEFSVFDKAGHLCQFDGNLIQNDVSLYFSGFIKPVYEDNPDVEGGYPCEKVGPITQWWIAGFEGEKAVLGLSSESADYYLLRPSQVYAPFLQTVSEKILVTKIVIEFLQSKTDEEEEDITYEDLLEYLKSRETPTNKEEMLIAFADFIYDQVLSYESTSDEDEPQLKVDSACMKKLAELGGIQPKENVQPPVKRRRAVWGVRKDVKFVKATTTTLVKNIFNPIFNGQLSESRSENVMIKPCTVRLTKLENLHRYEGSWKIRSNLKHRENDALWQLEKDCLAKKIITPCVVRLKPIPSDQLDKYLKMRRELKRNDEDFNTSFKSSKRKRWCKDDDEYGNSTSIPYKRVNKEKISWSSTPENIEDRFYYSCAKIGEDYIRVGNFVSILNDARIGQIKYMCDDDEDSEGMICHVQWFLRSCDTILGDVGNKQEIFLTEDCEDIDLEEIDSKLNVTSLTMHKWVEMGNFVVPEWLKEHAGERNTFFYQKRYEPKFGRFRDLPNDENVPYTCANCGRKRESENREIPLPIGRMAHDSEADVYVIKTVRWRDQTFSEGSCVFLTPGTSLKTKETTREQQRVEKYDEVKFPEKYRRKYTNEEEVARIDPFDVVYISKIFSKSRIITRAADVRLVVKKFYRPQNTHLTSEEANSEDLNLLYWSEEECRVKFSKVEGKCFVSYEKNLGTTVAEWSAAGPYRFYFTQTYNPASRCFTKPNKLAISIGDAKSDDHDANVPFDWPSIPRPLRTMDVFAGCGGLSEGLHQSGVAKSLWAIEKVPPPAKAFELNNKDATVYVADCNNLLQDIMEGKNKKLPKRGDVELLCGGPPCQGFSRMNRFKEGIYSKFKNSLVTTYLSYCDHFRPRFFILENVRDFVSTNQNMVFKLSVSCLVRMGYQVDFSVLQCGMYGIPQSRRRTIILAAAPGEILPSFPEPTHSFPLKTFLDVKVDDKKFVSDIQWTKSAPYRAITVSDAISDLPKIENNEYRVRMSHKNEPLTHFQRMMRGENSVMGDKLQDHVCKKLQPLILKRISYIPREPPGDWRDLPNIEIDLSDGTRTQKLEYTHNDLKWGKSPKGKLRGVCACAASEERYNCNNEWKQGNTLIPWCLPHTSNRHNQWSGLYGRIGWNSYFRTVVTNPEPMGKQGRVLHPEQDRVVSIRECARSQGFADSFVFSGSTLDKYAQIGNAVAPPLARAIGLEIKKCVAAKEGKHL